MKNLYRIYTENKQREDIKAIMDSWHIDGYTLIETVGVWKGQSEKGLIIELISELIPYTIVQIADAIKLDLSQEAVLVTSQDITSVLI